MNEEDRFARVRLVDGAKGDDALAAIPFGARRTTFRRQKKRSGDDDDDDNKKTGEKKETRVVSSFPSLGPSKKKIGVTTKKKQK